MTRTRRLVGLLAVAGGLTGVAQWHARGQQPVFPRPNKAVPEEPRSFEGVSLPVDREARRLIQAAQDYIKKKEWRVAAEQLQALLDAKEDTFFESDITENGKPAKRRVSVRKEANRLIGELPPEGLEFYQVQYGPAADTKLHEALEKHDAGILADVSLKYLHTKAGAEATGLLATFHLDQGNYLMAALCYERLLGRSDADKLTPKTLFKAALAYRRAGDVEIAEKVWKQLTDKAGSAPLAFGAKKLGVEQLRKEFERPVPLVALAGANNWPVFRGAPARNAQGLGGTAFLEPRWQTSMIVDRAAAGILKEDDDAAAWVAGKLKLSAEGLKDKPKLPTYFPVATNGKLFYRTYDGVYAVHLRDADTADGRVHAGDVIWASGTAGSLHGLARVPGRRSEVERWLNDYSDMKFNPSGVLFENSVVGTLCHDNQRVYFVDDLAVPPFPGRNNVNGIIIGGQAPTSYGELDASVKASRLCAVEIDTGKVVWTLGGEADAALADDRDAKEGVASAAQLQSTYFLGPPLPLGGKLFLLVERNAEFRLLCLDPNKPDGRGYPELLWQQALGTPNQRLAQDSVRRMQAVHLSYAAGILVVPTHSGVVLGVDLLSHSLVWSYSYLETPPQPEEVVFNPRRRINQAMPVSLNLDRWRTAAPALVNGKVVFTAHDAANLHCLNLIDGQPLWKVKRDEDDLYMAGVFAGKVLVVGKRHIKAINLDSGPRDTWGKQLWKKETGGPPAGQGAASDDVYYLPLQSTGDANQPGPGILAVNVHSGERVSVANRRNQEMPGNLLFVDGEIVSQTTNSVSAYPQEALKRAEITRRLKDNPRDPVGLAERGELYLYVGKMNEAVEDLRAALGFQPPPETRIKARAKLYEAFAELFQKDFPAAERYVDEFKALCKLELPADADATVTAKLTDDYNRRQDNYLSLVGRGREKQGRVLEALAAFEELGSRDDPNKLVSVVDEPNSSARRDVLARGRIKALFDQATPEQRKQLEGRLTERFRTLATGEVASVRKFVGVVGSFSRAGREAQLHLAERLLAANGSEELTEAETRLQGLCNSPEIRRQEPTIAARALEAMARVYVRRELFEDAVGLYKQLGTEFGSVPLRDGRTGADLLNDLYTDKRFLPYLEPAGLHWRGAFRATESPGANGAREFSLEPEGANLPFYQRNRLVLEMAGGSWKLVLKDRATNEQKAAWDGLPAAQYFLQSNVRSSNLRFAFARGHVVLLQLANEVFAYDLAEPGGRELWHYDLLGSRKYDAQTLRQMNLDDEGQLWVSLNTNVKERVGQVAVFEAGVAILQTDRGLVALDPRRRGPEVQWRRGDVSSKAHVFGDDEYVFAVEPPAEGTPATVRAFAAADGTPVAVPDFAALYATPKRLRVLGRHLLLQEDDAGGRTFRLYDIPSGKDVWKQSFAAGTLFGRSEDPTLAAVVEPDRTVTVLDVRLGEVQFKTHLDEDDADRLKELTLVADRERVYLALQRAPENGLTWSPLVSAGIRTVKTHGSLYALSRATGKIEWVCSMLDHQMLLLEQLQDLPLLIFAASSQRVTENGLERQQARLTAVDKRTGKLVCDTPLVQTSAFHSLRADPAKGSIELVRNDLKITFKSEPAAIAGPRP